MICDRRLRALEKLANIYQVATPEPGPPRLGPSQDGEAHAVGRYATLCRYAEEPLGNLHIHLDYDDPWKLVAIDEAEYTNPWSQRTTIAVIDLDWWHALRRGLNGWEWSPLPD